MGRLQGAFVAVALAALASHARAAEISRVASSGEPRNPFDLDLSVRWERLQERATVEREQASDELRFTRTRHVIVPRIAIGLWHDLELHAELPYVLADDRNWRFGAVGGRPSGGVPGIVSSIESNAIDANGDPCVPAPCQLFAVAPEQTVYHGGRAGDLEAGLAWAIFNDRRDETKPTWVIGVDVTFPTATRYDPWTGRDPADLTSPHDVPARPGAVGEKVWKWDFYTLLSRRMGAVDPYVKAHATRMARTSDTYSNCDHAAEMMSAAVPQLRDGADVLCAAAGDGAGAKLPWIAGLTVGTEFVPYEDRYASQRVAIDVRLFGDFTSAQRFYNELTDATGKIHQTGEHLTMGGLVGLYLRGSKHLSLQATASIATRTAHYVTGEDSSAANPNFDARWDLPGRRFRVAESTLFELGAAALLQF
jgi:hypothetical protein